MARAVTVVVLAALAAASLVTLAGPATAGTTTVERLIAEDLVVRVNAERALRGIRPLEWDPALARYASDWSDEMARSASFRHSDAAAVHAAPYGFPERSFGYGENIAWSVHPANATGGRLHVALMASDGHRLNLLQPRYDVVGIGVTCSADGNLWITQGFGVWWDRGSKTIDNTTLPPAQPVARTDPGIGCADSTLPSPLPPISLDHVGAPVPAVPATPVPAPPGACPAGAVPSAGFSDTAASAHRLSIDCVVWHGVANGVGRGTYAPGRQVTRGQMASFVARVIARSGADLPAPASAGFSDLGASPHADAVNRLAAAGIVAGRSPGRYEPDAQVTRAQVATFLVRAAAHTGGSSLQAGRAPFPDIAGNPHAASIAQAAQAGLVQGTSAGTYEPNKVVRRDQMATFVARLLDLFVQQGTLVLG